MVEGKECVCEEEVFCSQWRENLAAAQLEQWTESLRLVELGPSIQKTFEKLNCCLFNCQLNCCMFTYIHMSASSVTVWSLV